MHKQIGLKQKKQNKKTLKGIYAAKEAVGCAGCALPQAKKFDKLMMLVL